MDGAIVVFLTEEDANAIHGIDELEYVFDHVIRQRMILYARLRKKMTNGIGQQKAIQILIEMFYRISKRARSER